MRFEILDAFDLMDKIGSFVIARQLSLSRKSSVFCVPLKP